MGVADALLLDTDVTANGTMNLSEIPIEEELDHKIRDSGDDAPPTSDSTGKEMLQISPLLHSISPTSAPPS